MKFISEGTMLRKPLRSLLISSLLAIAASSVFAQAVIVAPYAPPPPRVETVPMARPGYVWDPGHWSWRSGMFVWSVGHWQPLRVGFRWIPGHWANQGRNWGWIPGHWV